VNPQTGQGSVEDDFDRQVSVAVGFTGMAVRSGLDEYDFRISASDIEAPQPWLALVTVHNLGTRAAAMVPVRVENEAGREITDASPWSRAADWGWRPSGSATY
jgi:hypothetical protein